MLANLNRICVVCEVGMFLIIDPIRVGGNLNELFHVVDLGAEGKERREFKDKKTRIERMNNEQRKDNFIYVLRDTFTIITFTLTTYKVVVFHPRIYPTNPYMFAVLSRAGSFIRAPDCSGSSARHVGLKNRKAYAALTYESPWPHRARS